MKLVSRRLYRNQKGQSLIEFTLCVSALAMLLMGSIQLALIGNAALATSQLAYAGARYAAVNPSYSSDTIGSYMKTTLASSTINENSGGDLTISVTPTTTPRSFGTQVTVTVTYNLSSKMLLPNPFMGISFPTSLSSNNSMMSE